MDKLSPSVVQLFSMSTSYSSSYSSSSSDSADSGFKSPTHKQKASMSVNQNKPKQQNHQHQPAKSQTISKKQANNATTPGFFKNNNNHHNNRNNSKNVRASSLSPTKTASTPNSSNKQAPNGHTAARSGSFGNGGRSPPRSPKPRQGRGGSCSSSSFKHNKSTAMTKPNNTSYENHSDSGQSSSGSTKSHHRNGGGFVKLATMTTGQKPNTGFHGGRSRSSKSFSQMAERDAPRNDLFAGSAASPDATALPQPPKAWLTTKNVSNKDTKDLKQILPAIDSIGKLMENCAIAPTKPTTTTTPPPANVQKFFASFTTPLVPITA